MFELSMVLTPACYSRFLSVKDSNQAAQFNSDKCPWNIKTCHAADMGVSVSVLAKLQDRSATDEQYLISSHYGFNLYVSAAGKFVVCF